MYTHQHSPVIPVPGPYIPTWVEELESLLFCSAWGPLGDCELLWLLEKCAFARWRVFAEQGEAELLRIAVEQSQRRQGHARLLMSECSRYLASIGCTTLHLEVRFSNIPAKRLYESLGWRQMNVRKKYYNDGEDAIVYSLRL